MTLTLKKLLTTRKAEYLVPILTTLSLIAGCIITSSKKDFWNDELFSYYFLADPSFGHMMMDAFHDKLNNTPALYFILGWLWARVFSASELSLRLFSSLGFCIALWITWLTLRRVYGFWAASFAALSVFTSRLILYQNSEARMYGLFMAIGALSLMQFDLNNQTKRCPRWILIFNFLIQTALVHIHLHGVFFGVATLVAQIARDKLFGFFRPRLYSSFVLGWLTLIFYIPAFLVQADAGKPQSWLTAPTLQDLASFISLFPSIYFNLSFLMLLTVLAGMQFFYQSGKEIDIVELEQPNRYVSEKKSLLIFAFTFLMVSFAIWLISRTVRPLFYDRYLLLTFLGLGILIAHFFSRVFPSYLAEAYGQSKIKCFGFLAPPLQVGLSVILLMMMLIPTFDAKLYDGNFLLGEKDAQYGYTNLPIVVQSSTFLERFYNIPESRSRYFYILDKQAAESPLAGIFTLQEYKHYDAWQRVYPEIFKENIVENEEFLNKYSKFLVVDYSHYDKICTRQEVGIADLATRWTNRHCPQWLETRIIQNPEYKVTVLGLVNNRFRKAPNGALIRPNGVESMLLVEKKSDIETLPKPTN